MTHAEALRALQELAASPAGKWIGNKFEAAERKLVQKCMRCGAVQVLELPAPVVEAFSAGARGNALAGRVPSEFDEKLFKWKRAFQIAHEGCTEQERS